MCRAVWASQVELMLKNQPSNARDIRTIGSIPRSGRSPGERHGNPLQYSFLENPLKRGAWRATVHSVPKSGTQLKQSSTHAHTGLNGFHCDLSFNSYNLKGGHWDDAHFSHEDINSKRIYIASKQRTRKCRPRSSDFKSYALSSTSHFSITIPLFHLTWNAI